MRYFYTAPTQVRYIDEADSEWHIGIIYQETLITDMGTPIDLQKYIDKIQGLSKLGYIHQHVNGFDDAICELSWKKLT